MEQKEKTFEILMKMAIEKFLKETGFDDKVWLISLTCSHCKTLCKAFTPDNTELMLFKCEKCKHFWQVINKPLGYDKKEVN